MIATDELRRLLDERGVEWEDIRDGEAVSFTAGGARYSARCGLDFTGPDGTLVVFGITPEQAIAATLGRGECKNRDADIYQGGMVFVCSACESMSTDGQPNYCPNCGRKVVE